MSTWTVIGYVNGNRLPAIAATRYVAGPYDNKRAALRVFEEWRRGLLGDLERIELREDGRVGGTCSYLCAVAITEFNA